MIVADESLLNQGIWVLLHTGGNLSPVMGRKGQVTIHSRGR
jgi:hypothetical protein